MCLNDIVLGQDVFHSGEVLHHLDGSWTTEGLELLLNDCQIPKFAHIV